jgi:hypothetical protein
MANSDECTSSVSILYEFWLNWSGEETAETINFCLGKVPRRLINRTPSFNDSSLLSNNIDILSLASSLCHLGMELSVVHRRPKFPAVRLPFRVPKCRPSSYYDTSNDHLTNVRYGDRKFCFFHDNNTNKINLPATLLHR